MTNIFQRDILFKKIFSGELMEKKYFYFQPEYVDKFKCDGSKCNAHCCLANWSIFVDDETFKQYSQLDSQEIISRIKFNDIKGEHVIAFDGKNSCPFLNENKLCWLQLNYGENFLSRTCATYPRITNSFGYFFERSLVLSCPVAAKMILFESEPMQFEFVEVPEIIHSPGGKIFIQSIQSSENLREHLIEIQIAMISILQERTLSIDQRLIVLGFFVDRLEEIFFNFDKAALTKLIAAYESKKFLAEQVPLMIQSVEFDAEKFIRLILKLTEKVFGKDLFPKDKKFLYTVADTLKIIPDENNFVAISKVAANYKRLAEVRRKFLAEHSTFLENYLVNDLFMSISPWQFEGTFAQNFAAFTAKYKLFELITFSAWLKGLNSVKSLLELTSWFITRFEHTKEYKQMIFDSFKDADDIFDLIESLLDGSD